MNARHDRSSVPGRIGSVIGALSLLACVLALATPASASFPGANGKLAFTSDPTGADLELYSMDADGSGQTNLTNNPDSDSTAAFSPDGQKIAFSTDRDLNDEIYVMNADGTTPLRLTSTSTSETTPAWSPDGQKILFTRDDGSFNLDVWAMNQDGSSPVALTSDPALDTGPAWSPNGGKIAFTTTRDGNSEIYVMNPDGSGATNLTSNPATDSGADWSPDAKRIAFASRRAGNAEIYVMNADGSAVARLTTNTASDFSPAWSPDGQKIAFRSNRDGNGYEIYTMNADGTNQTRLTNNGYLDTDPDWQPLTPGYARPKGATPILVSLVPAYRRCTSANSSHGAPLASPSCGPPTQASNYLTVGTPDANGKAAKSTGSLREDVIAGDPATPEDDADVALEFELTDVRRKSNLSDYVGQLLLQVTARITDNYNGYGEGSATVSDFPYAAEVACTSTADSTVGATCRLTTTANTLVPGSVLEGKRAIWELQQLQVFDGGSDGLASTTGDNTLFATQGVFVP
jgi:Tol biopolymer transport system component